MFFDGARTQNGIFNQNMIRNLRKINYKILQCIIDYIKYYLNYKFTLILLKLRFAILHI